MSCVSTNRWPCKRPLCRRNSFTIRLNQHFMFSQNRTSWKHSDADARPLRILKCKFKLFNDTEIWMTSGLSVADWRRYKHHSADLCLWRVTVQPSLYSSLLNAAGDAGYLLRSFNDEHHPPLLGRFCDRGAVYKCSDLLTDWLIMTATSVTNGPKTMGGDIMFEMGGPNCLNKRRSLRRAFHTV